MGLIKAAISAVKGNLADQYKEYFACDSMPADVLVVKGYKITKGNNNGNDDIITNGSTIAVADGQCMIIVDDGKVVEISAEPGVFTYDSSSEASVFSGNLGESIIASFKNMGKRLTYGGDTGKRQNVYFFNTKEIVDNKFGTANPVPFRVVDTKIGLDLDATLRCSGVYSYRITDPILFYTNVCGNVSRSYTRSEIDNTLKTEFISALQTGLAKLSDMELRPNQIIAHNSELEDAMNEALDKKWGSLRGIEVVNIALGSVTLPEEYQKAITQKQLAATNKDAAMAMAATVEAQNQAMLNASQNTAGAMAGFMNMNMASMTGANALNALQGMQAQQAAQQAQAAPQAAAGWTCSCGQVNTGKFCSNCGSPKPAPASWTCSCGTVNTGKFCSNCGSPRA